MSTQTYFLKFIALLKKRGIDRKSNFHIIFKTYKGKTNWEVSLAKNPENYEKICHETNIYEQKPISIDERNDVEESGFRACVEKRKEKRREIAEKNKLKKNKERTRTT